MRLTLNKGLQKFVLAAGTTILLKSMDAKRSPNMEIEVQFVDVDGVTPIELSAGASGIFEVKTKGRYDQDPALTGAFSWVKTGTGQDTLYTFTLPLVTDGLDALLGVSPELAFTVNAGTDLITHAAHGLVAGNIIQMFSTTTLPGPFAADTDYFVIASGLTANDFKVSATLGGTAVDITDAGTGTHKFVRVDNDVAEVTLMAAMQWIADGRTNESQTLDFVLQNDVVREGDVGSPPPAAYAILNVQAGKQAITNGTDTGSVVYGTAFAGGANVDVVCVVAKPAGGDNIFATVKDDTVTETGFQYDLSAPVPATGYKLNWMAVAV